MIIIVFVIVNSISICHYLFQKTIKINNIINVFFNKIEIDGGKLFKNNFRIAQIFY